MPREFEQVEYRFTEQELLALGKELAHENQLVYNLRAEKASVDASLSAAIKAGEAVVADLTGKIERKSEMRATEVVTVLDKPRTGFKTIARADNGLEVRQAVMSEQEKQWALDLGEPAHD